MNLQQSTTERLVLVVATVVLAVGLAGSAWVATSASTAGGPQIDADVDQRYESIDGLSGTRTTTIERDGTVTSERTFAVELRPGTNQKRVSLVDGTPTRHGLRVSNGSVLWLLDRSENAATRIPLSGVANDSARSDRIRRLFARLDATRATGETPVERPTVEPLPVVPQSGAGRPEVTGPGADATFGVEYVGTATVADRDAYVLRIAPADDAANASYEQTLWIDAERFFPLKQRTAWTEGGERRVLTTAYETVRFDPGLDDDAFAPDLPANATVRVPETPETTTYRTVGALRAATDVPIPDPTVPRTFELTYATRTDGGVHGVGLRYVNSTSRVTVAKYNFTYREADGDERLTVDGRTAQLNRGTAVTLSWNCESYRYTVRGRGLSADAVVDIGRSVGCPA